MSQNDLRDLLFILFQIISFFFHSKITRIEVPIDNILRQILSSNPEIPFVNIKKKNKNISNTFRNEWNSVCDRNMK